MATKSLIVICQYDGEFVTGKDGSLSYRGGDAYAIGVDDQMMFDDFKMEVTEMFNCSVSTMSIKYFVPGNTKTLITVSDDEDLKQMLKVHADFITVYVYVVMEGIVAPDVSNMSASRSSRTTLSEEVPPLDQPCVVVDDFIQPNSPLAASLDIVDDTNLIDAHIDLPPDSNSLNGWQVMATKSLIVICQSGGEFVTEKDGSLSYRGGDAYAIGVDDQMMFDDFKMEVTEMFNCSVSTMSIKYFVPGNTKTLITVSDDEDLKQMLKVHADFIMVYVYVVMKGIVAPDASNMSASRSSRTTLSEEVPPLDQPCVVVDDFIQPNSPLAASLDIVDDTNLIDAHIDLPPDSNSLNGWQVMATKSLIVICQYGGEFVTEKDGSLSYRGGDAYAIGVDDQMMFDDFKMEVTEMFNCSVSTMSIKYFVPGNTKTLITVSDDEDLKQMLKVHADFIMVYVYVVMKGIVAPDASNMSASRSSRTTLSEEVPPLDQPCVVVDDFIQPNSPLAASLDIVDDTNLIDAHIDLPPDSNSLNGWQVMATKSLIVICQYGGEFVTEKDGSLSYRGGDAYAIGVDDQMMFDDFKMEVTEMFNCSVSTMSIKYFVPGNTKTLITVSDDEDLKQMLKVHADFIRVYVYVVMEGIVAPDVSNMSVSRSSRTTLSEEVPPLDQPCIVVDDFIQPNSPLAASLDIVDDTNLIDAHIDLPPDIKQEYGMDLNYHQARRANEIAMEQLQGSYKDAYSQLPFFCDMIMETNPGSLAMFATKEDSSFHRLFISFQASWSGFVQGCRPLLFLDSIPLKSKYQGMLLTTTAADGDDGVFPVAFAIVDAENNDNWHWFLLQLKSVVSTSCSLTFIAARQKGLQVSISEIFNGSYHGYCLRYLAEEFVRDLEGQFSHEVKNTMVEYLYQAASAPKLEDFRTSVESIKEISLEAYSWIMQSEPQNWANSFFQGARYNHMTSNFGERFYSWVSDAHELPITQMVDVIQGKIMELIYTRRADSNRWLTRLTPSMEEKLEKESLKVCSLLVLPTTDSLFEVQGESTEVIDLDHCWDCSCKGWQLTGLPCCHAIAVINSNGLNPYDYCSRYFTTERYRLTYAKSVQPIPDVGRSVQKDSSQALVSPPTRCTPGRPKRKL